MGHDQTHRSRRLRALAASVAGVAVTAAAFLVTRAVPGDRGKPERSVEAAGAPAAFPVAPPPTEPATTDTTAGRPVSTTTTSSTPATIALGARLDAILVNTESCLEVRDGAGRVVYAHQPGLALSPASTQKLLVAAAALDVLGPGYRFVTSVVGARRPVDGEVDQLWLVGGGDPVLSSPAYTAYLMAQPLTAGHPVTTQLGTLVALLAAHGVRSVPGGIHGDDGRYDRTRFLPTWKPLYLQEGDVAPLGALEVDDGLDSWRPAVLTADPAGHAAGALAGLATAAGIPTVQAADGSAPPRTVVLAAVQSPPLADIVTAMLRDSDNTAAEMLVRELDRVAGTRLGTTAGGVQVVMREAARLGLPVAGLRLVDGSGLSPEDRASCNTLLAALSLSSQSRFAAMGMLSVAGRFGTLVHRYVGTPAAGRLAAKTGNIEGAVGLVGRMDEGPPIDFSFLINGGFPYVVGAGYEDRLVEALGTLR